MPWARSPAIIPASTSPAPAVASQAGALALIAALPSGVGDHRVAALEQHHAAGARGGGARRFQLAGAFIQQPGKQPLEFAGMGRQHAAVMQPIEQRVGIVLERGQRIGIQHHRGARLASAASTSARVSPPTPRPGPSTTAFSRLSESSCAKPVRAVERLDHDGGEMGGIHRHRIRRRGDADQPCPDPQRRRAPPAAPRRWRAPAAHHHAMAAGIFVAFRLRPGIAPAARACSHAVAVAGALRRNADIGHHDLAAQRAAGQQQMPRLLAEEGDGQRRRDIHTPPSGWPVSPDTPLGTSIATTGRSFSASTTCARRAFQRPRQAGAEQPIHHQPRAVQRRRRQRHARAFPLLRHRRRIALAAPRRCATRTVKPYSSSSRATTKPSPPLLPGPHSTVTGTGLEARGDGVGHRAGRHFPSGSARARHAPRQRRRPAPSARW